MSHGRGNRAASEAESGPAPRAPSPPPRRLGLPILVTVSIVLAAVAGAIARGFVSPAQQAAHASAPTPSLITAPVRYGVLPLDLVMRATVRHDDPVSIQPPQNLAGAPVTSVDVAAGQQIQAGQLLGTVAEQPVFVMKGRVPAFRPITLGTTGVDVAELQAGLTAAGHGIGDDPQGVYGPGTAAAVLELYRAAHVQPDIAPGAEAQVAQRIAQLARAEHAVGVAAVRLEATERRHGSPGLIGSGRRALNESQARERSARDELQRAERAAEPVVPLGSVVFIPHLPGEVLSVAALGSRVGAGAGNPVGGRGGSRAALASIGSARVTLSVSAGQSALSQLRPGMTGTATSELSGRSLRVRATSASANGATFWPLGRVPSGFVGQNVQVNVVARRIRSFIVPISAVSTSASGRTYVTLVRTSGKQRIVWVRLGLSAGGRQAVSSSGSGLRRGDHVVIGEQVQ